MTDDAPISNQAPVSLPEDDLESRSITWPTLLGGTSILYAGISLAGDAFGVLGLFVERRRFESVGLEVEGGLDLPEWVVMSTLVESLVNLALIVWLVFGAIALIRRSPRALRLLRIWVVASILAALIQVGLGFLKIDDGVDLEIRKQRASEARLREGDRDVSKLEIIELGFGRSSEQIRSASVRNTLSFGVLPVIYPLVMGFFIFRGPGRPAGRTDGSD